MIEEKLVALPAGLQILLDSLAAQQAAHAQALAAVDSAARDEQSALAVVADLKKQIASKEAALASSGSPAEQFAEDQELVLAERNGRVASLRTRTLREAAVGIEEEVNRLAGEIEGAWFEFGRELYREHCAGFERELAIIEERLRTMMVLGSIFSPRVRIKIPAEVLNTTDPRWAHRNRPQIQPVFTELTELRREVESKIGRQMNRAEVTRL